MAWACDYCRGPQDPLSGGQGMRERCADPGCVGSADSGPKPFEETHETLTVTVAISKALLNGETQMADAVADMVGEDAKRVARDAVLARMRGDLVDISTD